MVMNIEMLDLTIKWLDRQPLNHPLDGAEYNHCEWVEGEPESHTNWCGTTMCVAGFVASYMQPEYVEECLREEETPDVEDIAQEALGLTDTQAQWLFMGYFSPYDNTQIDAAETIGAIQFLKQYPSFEPNTTQVVQPYSAEAREYVL